MALEGQFRKLATELKNQYRVVYFRAPALIGPEKINMSVARPGLIVRAPQTLRKETEAQPKR